ncbi:MAG: hypothetical protein JOZ15_16170, partial [Acidobacteria bacterium]|nr:hypothetical protein [Acidobacteriota bacterium]
HISPRGDRLEAQDLRGPAQDLAALLRPTAHKQQVKIEVLLPEAAVPVLAQRHQLRQALLHLGLSALELLPRDGKLQIRLDRLPAPPRARLRIAAAPAPDLPGGPAFPPAAWPARPPHLQPGSRPEPEPRYSAAGTEARLAVARAILLSFGATLRQVSSGAFVLPAAGGAAAPSAPAAPSAQAVPSAQAAPPASPAPPLGEPAAPREIPAYEIEFPALESN